MDDKSIIIVGAGPAGLATAYEFIRLGMKPIVIEKADRVGGIARTESRNDYYFDIGGHRFFTKIEKVDKTWHDMLDNDFIKTPRMSRIYYRGRFFNYPLALSNALFTLGIIESLFISASYIKAQIRPYPMEDTFDQWISNRFGQRMYQTFFKTYTEKVWGIPCQRIKADWAAQRIKGLSLMTVLIDTLLGIKKAKTLVNEFYYPLKGPGMMWKSFQKAIEEGGGQVLLNSEVIRLKHENDFLTSAAYTVDNKTLEIPVDHVISSMPITELINMFEPHAPDTVFKASNKLSYRSFIIVILIVNKKDLFPDQWIYIHDPDVRVGRIQNFKNWSEAMVPDLDKTSVGMEYFCGEGDEIWSMTDRKLANMASRELMEIGIAEVDDIMDFFVVRQPKAYPVYDDDYKESLKSIKNYLESFKNFQTIGRNGLHRYNNMDHSMLTGILAVQNFIGANHDLWDITEKEDYFEEEKKEIDGRVVIENILGQTFARMDKLAFATAIGSVSGLLIFFATIWLIVKGGPVIGQNLRLLSQYFIGYTVTLKGAFIALGYGFLWGFLFGWLFAYLRNLVIASYLYWVKKKTELLTLEDFFDNL